jgi:hypothetical protein
MSNASTRPLSVHSTAFGADVVTRREVVGTSALGSSTFRDLPCLFGIPRLGAARMRSFDQSWLGTTPRQSRAQRHRRKGLVYAPTCPRYCCTKRTAMLPSPTAAATRLTEFARTSPAAKTPGRLVSSG